MDHEFHGRKSLQFDGEFYYTPTINYVSPLDWWEKYQQSEDI